MGNLMLTRIEALRGHRRTQTAEQVYKIIHSAEQVYKIIHTLVHSSIACMSQWKKFPCPHCDLVCHQNLTSCYQSHIAAFQKNS